MSRLEKPDESLPHDALVSVAASADTRADPLRVCCPRAFAGDIVLVLKWLNDGEKPPHLSRRGPPTAAGRHG